MMQGRFMPGGPMPAGPSAMPQNVIVGPGHMPGGGPLPAMGGGYGGYRPPGMMEKSGRPLEAPSEPPKTPKKRGRKPKETPPVERARPAEIPIVAQATGGGLPMNESVIPTTVTGHEGNAPQAAAAGGTGGKKGGGRRKKITPSREELEAAKAAAMVQEKAAAAAAVEPTRGSILSERLEAGSGKRGRRKRD